MVLAQSTPQFQWASPPHQAGLSRYVNLLFSEGAKHGREKVWPGDQRPDGNTITTLGGYYVSGKRVKEDDPHGVWLARSLDQKTVQLMIPWRFVHALIAGSAEQVKQFGFVKD